VSNLRGRKRKEDKMARRLAQRDMREIAPRRNITMRLARDELYQSVQMQYQALETRLSVVEARLQITQPEQQASTSASVAAPRRLAAPLVSRGYLVKDIDSFAGFAHAINTYLAGVALADVHGRQLLYMPFRAAHGLEYAFDDFLTSDPRGMAPPLAAPRLTLRDDAQPLINGLPASLMEPALTLTPTPTPTLAPAPTPTPTPTLTLALTLLLARPARLAHGADQGTVGGANRAAAARRERAT
jgi:hypothetical protein